MSGTTNPAPKVYTVPEGFALEVFDSTIYDANKEDSAFYTTGDAETLVKVSFEDEEFIVLVAGEMRIELPDGNSIRNRWQLDDAGIETDAQLREIDENAWQNNSWFEAYDAIDGDISYENEIFGSVEDAIKWCVESIQFKINGGEKKVNIVTSL